MAEKKEYRYTIILEPCEEGGYFAMCPAFPGCQVQGETYEEAIREASCLRNNTYDIFPEQQNLYFAKIGAFWHKRFVL